MSAPHRTIRVSPSIIAADFSRLSEALQASAEADWIHLDVMDAHFVPNLTFGPLVVEAIKRLTPLPLDVHLMMTHPHRYLEAFVRAGSHWITVHVESEAPFPETLRAIRDLGARPGIALNPETPVASVLPLLPHVDLVLVMSVHPGFAGQRFLPDVLPKVRTLASIRDREGFSFLLSIDGGIHRDTAPLAVEAGVDVLVAGSFVYRHPDPAARIRWLKTLGG